MNTNEQRKSWKNLWGVLLPPQNIATVRSAPIKAGVLSGLPVGRSVPDAVVQVSPQTATERFATALQGASTIEECVDLYVNATPGSTEESAVLGKLMKMPSGSDDLVSLVGRVSADCALGVWATGQLLGIIEKLSFTEKVRTIVSLGENSSVGIRLLSSLKSTVATVREWGWAGKEATDGSALDTFAAGKIAELSGAPADFYVIACENSGEVESVALRRLTTVEGTVDDFKVLYDSDDDEKIRRIIIGRILGGVTGIAILISLYGEFDDGEMRSRIIERLKVEPASKKEIADALDSVDGDSDLWEILFKRVLPSCDSVSQLIGLYGQVDDDDNKESIIKRLEELSWTSDDVTSVLQSAGCGTRLEELAFERKVIATDDPLVLLALYFEMAVDHSDCDLGDIQMQAIRRCGSMLTPREKGIIRLLAGKSGDTDFTEVANEIDPKPSL